MSKEEHLRTELASQIKRFNAESTKHKRLYRGLRFLALGLTGCSTVLASAALVLEEGQDWLNLAVVGATAAAGLTASVEGLRKPAELWIHERKILYALRDLQREMDYEAAETAAPLDVDPYFERLQSILVASTEKWSRTVQKPKQNGS